MTIRRILPLFLPLLLLAAPAGAGGIGDRVVLVVDPADAESLYLANLYRAARDVPARNILTMSPGTDGDYEDLAARNLEAFLDTLRTRGLDDHVDQVLLMPTRAYRIAAPGLLTDPCSGVGHLALASAYTTAFVKDEILGGSLMVWEANRYHRASDDTIAFDGSRSWLDGSPSTAATARRYLVGAQLGYTGANGNTLADLVALVARSAAADGTRPTGTIYLMETANEPRSGPRDPLFPTVESSLIALGQPAEHLLAVLPTGRHDCLGIMTGYAAPSVSGADMTILPGAFCDHLTSFAGCFDAGSQTRMSAWIARGASGTAGAVEEPCNYAGKFPTARVHLHYAQGLTLGEAYFRSAAYVPFQILLYGDPLTRPFAHVPVVSVPDAPDAAVSDEIVLTPQATTSHPTASIAGFHLLVDGVVIDSVGPGGSFTVDTRPLDDGHHDLRVVARDDSSVRTAGTWTGAMTTSNRGHAATLSVSPSSGNLATAFSVTAGATGGSVEEVRLLHNGRVVAASTASPATFLIHGTVLGAGPARPVAEARMAGGRRVRSAPRTIDIAYAGGSAGAATPVAFSCTKVLPAGATTAVELPATHRDDPADATYEVVGAPSIATVLPGTDAGFRLLRTPAGASGTETMTFRVTTPSGTSGIATVTLVHGEETVEPDSDPEPEETLVLVAVRGDVKDREKPGKDKLEVKGTIAFGEESPDAAIDPATEATRVSLDGEEGLLSLEIPAGDPGWKRSGDTWKYRSADGVRPKVRLKLKLGSGTFLLKVKKADLPVAPVNPLLFSLEIGDDRGAHETEWRVSRPGRYKLR